MHLNIPREAPHSSDDGRRLGADGPDAQSRSGESELAWVSLVGPVASRNVSKPGFLAWALLAFGATPCEGPVPCM